MPFTARELTSPDFLSIPSKGSIGMDDPDGIAAQLHSILEVFERA